jgi:hypothetical protein
MEEEVKLGDTVIIRWGVAYGWGRIIAIDPQDETLVLVSWETIGLKRHPKTSLKVIDTSSPWAKEYIEYLYGSI